MKRAAAFRHLSASFVTFCCIAFPSVVVAGEKQYPLEGTVTMLGTNQESSGTGDTLSTHPHRTYTVKTPARTFVLECPNGMDNLLGKRECGGKKQIEIGDTLRMRVEKRYAYVQTDKQKEQRLTVLSEGVNEDTAKASKP